jgi:hypothetical protein
MFKSLTVYKSLGFGVWLNLLPAAAEIIIFLAFNPIFNNLFPHWR